MTTFSRVVLNNSYVLSINFLNYHPKNLQFVLRIDHFIFLCDLHSKIVVLKKKVPIKWIKLRTIQDIPHNIYVIKQKILYYAHFDELKLRLGAYRGT